jgi:hypothetical protein
MGEARRFRTLLEKLRDLKKEVSAKPSKKTRASKSQIKQEVADAFLKHIEAPRGLMAERSAQLLPEFYIPAEPEGMREYFKKK